MPELSDFKPQEKNANKHTEYGLTLLERSVQENGWLGAITAAADGEVFAGSARLEKLAELMPDVEPIVVKTDGKTPVIIQRTDIPSAADKRAIRAGLADNRVQEVDLEFDSDVLADIYAADQSLLEGLWNDDELLEMGVIEEEHKDAEPQIDRAEELQDKWQVKTGDLWQIGEHRLICGDCTDAAVVERLMGGETGMVFSDPPYGIDVVSGGSIAADAPAYGKVGGGNIVKSNVYSKIEGDETTDAAEGFYSVCLDYGISDYIFWGGNYFTEFLPASRCWLVWDKKNTGNFADVELAWTSFDKSAVKYEWLWNGLSRQGSRKEELSKRAHPTQKPVGLHKLIMADFPAEIYIDGFVGSGTTLVACENLNRKGRGIEISPKYCAVTLERMSQAFPELVIERIL